MTRQAVNYLIRLAGEKAKLGRVWPHMLRHSCGYYLADQGTDSPHQAGLPRSSRPHTAPYTRVAGRWFEGRWKG
jgi:type 1 fimbriae regulatory protein FimB